jgi:signal peptidase I
LSNKPRIARRETLFICVFLVVVVLFVNTYCMGVVRGASMEPTYQDGQVVLVRRRNAFSPALHRNDVVLLQRDRGEVIIKRVYRVPGDELEPGYPYLVGLTEPRGLKDYYEQEVVKIPHGREVHFYVPQGYIVVLGDNPDVSEDSRYFGPIPISSVLGTVADAPGPPPSALDRPPPAANSMRTP